MESVLAEMPLTIFTTLVPFGAGAFIALAFCGVVSCANKDEVKAFAQVGFVPLAITAIAFVAAFFHLANPLHAVWVLLGTGSSPLTNEVLAGVVFFVAAAFVCILGALEKLSVRAFKAGLVAAAVLGLVFVLLMGLAYSVDTVATWSSPYLPAIAISEAFAAGALLVLAVSSVRHVALSSAAQKLLLVFIVCSAAVALVCEALWFMGVGSASTALVDASALASQQFPVIACACALLAVAALVGCASLKIKPVVLSVLGAILFCAGIFLVRVAFYALRISVGL